MDVIRKTFKGGYKFSNFEGQPSSEIRSFKALSHVTGLAIEPDGGTTAAQVLNTLGLTAFYGPDSARVPTQGTIEASLVKHVVVSIVEVEPFDLSNEALLKGIQKDRFIQGLKNIHESYMKAKVTLILGNHQLVLVELMTQLFSDLNWIDIATITGKYPANLKELSIPTVLGKKYPVGYGPAQLGVLFLSVSDVLHVEKAVNRKVTLDSTYVALSGTGWRENVILDIPVGTPMSELKKAYLGDGEVRLVKNSVLNRGVLEDEDVVDFDTRVIIALPEDRKRQTLHFLRPGKHADSISNAFLSRFMPKVTKEAGTKLHGQQRACISCTYCQKVCPVGLIPHLLHKHAEKEIINKRVADYRIFDCIGCGLCTYVCPSKINVSGSIKRGKELMEKNEITHNDYVIPYCDMILEASEVADHE